MSDRHLLGIADLDTAFARLTADVGSRTRPRGADRAIRTARRRRLFAAGVALGATAMVAVVLAGGLGLYGKESVSPVATQDTLPKPRTFDAAALNEAAEGWTRGWTKGKSTVSTDLPCDPYDGELPEPLDTTTTEFRAGPRIGATQTVERYDTAENMRDSLPGVYADVSSNEICSGEYIQLPDEMIWSGGESVEFVIRVGRQSIYSLVVMHETEIAVLRVAGTGEMPEPTRERIVLALLADLRT